MTTSTSSGWVARKSRMSPRTSASGVDPSSQNVWQRYMPRLPGPRKPSRSRSRSAASLAALAGAAKAEPLAQPQRGVDARLADAVLRDLALHLFLAAEVRARATVRKPVGVVRIDQQAADAVRELAGDRVLLQRGVP